MDTQKQENYSLHQVIEQSFDFSNYSAEEKQAAIDETAGMIMEATLLRALEIAGDDAADKFGTFVESEPTEEAMSTYIAENFPNFGELILSLIHI